MIVISSITLEKIENKIREIFNKYWEIDNLYWPDTDNHLGDCLEKHNINGIVSKNDMNSCFASIRKLSKKELGNFYTDLLNIKFKI